MVVGNKTTIEYAEVSQQITNGGVCVSCCLMAVLVWLLQYRQLHVRRLVPVLSQSCTDVMCGRLFTVVSV
jgi:hypothetical protein